MKIKAPNDEEHIKGVESNKIFTCGVGKDFEKSYLSPRGVGGGNL